GVVSLACVAWPRPESPSSSRERPPSCFRFLFGIAYSPLRVAAVSAVAGVNPDQTPMLPQSLVDLLPHPLSTPAGAEGRTLPTGVEALDARLVGGGLPRGRLTEVVGARGSGKVTLLRQIVARTLSEAGWVAYIDAT